MIVPKPSNRKVNRSIPTKATPCRRCSVLIKTDVMFWKTKLHVKNNRHWKYFVGHQMKSDPSIAIRSETTNRLVEPTRWPLMTLPLALPLAPPLNPLPPQRDNKVWRRRKTAHSWRPVSSPPAKKDDEMPLGASQFRQRNWFCYFEQTRLQDKSHIPSQRNTILSLRPRCERVYHPIGQSDHQNPRIECSELYLQPQPLPPLPRPQ